jgi:hypothetical protein
VAKRAAIPEAYDALEEEFALASTVMDARKPAGIAQPRKL